MCIRDRNGTQGVGRAANLAVVISMYLIFIEEITIVQLINLSLIHISEPTRPY